ncbi:MAG: hypothetical protein ACYTGG_12430 [Planctomycetota bacterium]
MNRMHKPATLPALVLLLLLPTGASAQAPIAPATTVQIAIDSGPVRNESGRTAAVFVTDVHVPEARWLRLRFGRISLGPSSIGGPGSILRITSLLDGAAQQLTYEQALQWRLTSAYFNGPAVRVEVIAAPGDAPSRIIIDEAMVDTTPPGDGGGVANLCGEDDRVPSEDPSACRLLPVVCSGWMISDCQHCFLTAGHCFDASLDLIVAEFNVPPSDPDGWSQHPPPEFQFAIDPHSVQYRNEGFGKDWAYFGCLPNSNTGLTPFETQGAAYTLADTLPPVAGQDVRITGYGTDYSPGPERNRTQQTEAGPFMGHNLQAIWYFVDTTSGSSGSVVIDESIGLAIGIHNSSACNTLGYNVGTGIHNPDFQAALAEPRGVCAPPPLWSFTFPDGLPGLLAPDGGSFRVLVEGEGDEAPVPGTGLLHVQADAGFDTFPMVEISPNLYDAVFPPVECGAAITFYLSAMTVGGETITVPRYADSELLSATSAYANDTIFLDDFETDTGWSVVNSPELSGGAWERGRPDGFGIRGDPAFDADGSGLCYLTQNFTGNSDVDDGSTTLISPRLDATDGPDPTVSYWRWFDNALNNSAPNDVLVVEVSDDDGASWLVLETIGPSGPEVAGGWFRREFVLAEIPGLQITSQFRIRFTASDTGVAHVVEAGIDDVRLNRVPGGLVCAAACVADCAPDDGDGVVDEVDLQQILADWGATSAACDPSGDGLVDIVDLLELLAAWGACP